MTGHLKAIGLMNQQRRGVYYQGRGSKNSALKIIDNLKYSIPLVLKNREPVFYDDLIGLVYEKPALRSLAGSSSGRYYFMRALELLKEDKSVYEFPDGRISSNPQDITLALVGAAVSGSKKRSIV